MSLATDVEEIFISDFLKAGKTGGFIHRSFYFYLFYLEWKNKDHETDNFRNKF